jgi:hypothetical protein
VINVAVSMTVVHYRFLPEISAGGRQIGLNLTTKRLKLRKTLHLADTIGGGKRIQENPPPGTSPKYSRSKRFARRWSFDKIASANQAEFTHRARALIL